jgi:hypothetical protein
VHESWYRSYESKLREVFLIDLWYPLSTCKSQETPKEGKYACNQLVGHSRGSSCGLCSFISLVHRLGQGTDCRQFLAQGLQKRQPWKMLFVIAQHLLIALVLAYFIGRLGKVDWLGAVLIGVLLWIGLSAMQWVGSMVWEKVPSFHFKGREERGEQQPTLSGIGMPIARRMGDNTSAIWEPRML